VISVACLNRSIGRIALLKFFPAANEDALEALAEVLSELCADDGQLGRAMAAVSKEHVEWPGLGAFQETIREALRPPWKPKCAKCGDHGFRFEGASYVPCECPPGRARAREEEAETQRRLEFTEAETARRAILREPAESGANPDPIGRAVEAKHKTMSQFPL
jgi:hypothetical protein